MFNFKPFNRRQVEIELDSHRRKPKAKPYKLKVERRKWEPKTVETSKRLNEPVSWMRDKAALE